MFPPGRHTRFPETCFLRKIFFGNGRVCSQPGSVTTGKGGIVHTGHCSRHQDNSINTWFAHFFWRCTIPDHPLPGELTFNYFLVCRKPQEERPTWKLDFGCGIQSSWPLHIACFGACGSRLTIDCCFISDQATHWWFIVPHSPALLSAFLSINWLDVLFASWHQVVELHSIVSVGLLCCETKRARIRTNVPIDPTFLRQPNWNNQRSTNEMSWDVACHVPMFFN